MSHASPINVNPPGGTSPPQLTLSAAGWPDSMPPPRLAARQMPASGREILSVGQWNEIGLSLRLSPRELQIVQAVFDDLKESAIAGSLGISAHTVHTHLERLYRKCGVRGRSMLIVRVFAEFLRLNGVMRPAEQG